MEQDLRASGEHAVATHLGEIYGLAGNVSTAVKGVNWTLAVEDKRQAVALVRLYRPSGRLVADVAAELAVLDAVEGTATGSGLRPRRCTPTRSRSIAVNSVSAAAMKTSISASASHDDEAPLPEGGKSTPKSHIQTVRVVGE